MAQYPQNVNNCQSLKVQSIEKKMFMKKYWGMLSFQYYDIDPHGITLLV